MQQVIEKAPDSSSDDISSVDEHNQNTRSARGRKPSQPTKSNAGRKGKGGKKVKDEQWVVEDSDDNDVEIMPQKRKRSQSIVASHAKDTSISNKGDSGNVGGKKNSSNINPVSAQSFRPCNR